jgi:small subunit ribosomal protein S2
MSDPTVEPSTATEAGVPLAPTEKATAFEPVQVGIRELMEAGVHFGHQTRRWNPRMKPFLFGERNGVHIVDLDQTLPRLNAALELVREAVAQGGRVLFVSTKRQAQEPIQLEATRSGQFYVNNRWLGGMLTNFKTVKKSIERFKQMLELVADEEKVAGLSKKELSRINRSIDKYRKSLDGMKEMERLPDVVFVLDVNREAIAVTEARRLGIPIVAVVDSNCNPRGIDYVIPGNDDSIRAITLFCSQIAQACLEGAEIHNDRIQAQEAEQERARTEEKPAGATGRVVVEIKQPPRRGRGATFGGDRDDSDLGGAEADAKLAAAAPAVAETPVAVEEAPAAATEGETAEPAAEPAAEATTEETK